MASVLAIVSKAVFEKIVKARGSGELGDVLGIDRYTSKHASLSALEAGGAIFLVTVRPPDEALWLVGILENPTFADDGWHSEPSTAAITDVSHVKSQLQFATGAGLTAKPGALGMSLQTPRVLTDADATLLRGGKAKPAKAAATKSAPAKPASAKPASAPAKSAKSAPAAKSTQAAKTAARDDSAAGSGLGAIADAIADGDGGAALEAALATWRANRAPELADLIDAISARVSAPAVVGDSEFGAVAKNREPLDLGRLLPSIRELPVSFLPTAVELLAAFPDDPRLASAARDWALDPPTQSSSTYPFWTKLLAALERIGDTRVLAAFAKRVKMPGEASKQFPKAKNKKPSQFWGKLYTSLDKTAAKLKALPAPAKVDSKAIAKLVKAANTLDVETAVPAKPKAKSTAPKVDGPALAQALAHANAGRVLPAIAALADYWRDHRAPRVADLIDRATRLLPSYDRTLPAEPKAAHAAWMAAFADDPMAELPCLLFHLRSAGIRAAERQLIELASLPDDPRIALALAEVAICGGGSPERTQYWKSMWELIARIRDVRTAWPLRTHFSDFSGTYFNHHRQGRRILGDFVVNPPPPPELDAATLKQLGQIETAIAKLEAAADRTERDFIDAIVKDWSDEGPRLVYADWLGERGHNRGETIVLDCKKAREPLSKAEALRLRQLEGTYTEHPHTYGAMSELEYDSDRGIPHKLHLSYNACTITLRRLAGDPLLACIEAIELDEPRAVHPDDLAAVLLAPHAKRLTTVTRVPTDVLDAVEPLVAKTWKAKAGGLVRK